MTNQRREGRKARTSGLGGETPVLPGEAGFSTLPMALTSELFHEHGVGRKRRRGGSMQLARRTTMPKALAVLVGLRKVNPAKYDGWDGTNGCWGCELDVDNVERILQPLKFQITALKSEKATRRNVMKALATATQLKKNDIFVFYYSGHGGQQPDQTRPKKDELDGKDETLVMYDGELRDDSLNDVWLKLRPGVRVVMLSDSCNSGTNYKALRVDLTKPTPIAPLDAQAAREMKGQLIHMGGCRDSRTSAGYASGGLFTMALCNVWHGGTFKGDYKALYDAISKVVTSEQPDQQPAYNEYGPVGPAFRQQKPFAV